MRIVSPLAVIATALTGAKMVATHVGTTARSMATRAAQETVLDAGSFTISRGGTTVGREAFSIRHISTGYVATATVVYADQRLIPVLTMDSAGLPVRYQLEVRSGTGRDLLLTGQAAAGYFSIRTQTRRGEASRELPLTPRSHLIDDGIFHQWYFLAQGTSSTVASVPLLRPRDPVQGIVHVDPPAGDTIRIDSRLVSAVHTRTMGADSVAHDIWTDTDGHLLAVSQDSGGTKTIARRDELP